MKGKALLLLPVLLFFLGAGPETHGDILEVRSGLGIAPEKFLSQSVKAIELRNWDRAEKCFQVLTPLVQKLDRIHQKNFHKKISLALEEKNKEKSLQGFLELIGMSIQSLIKVDHLASPSDQIRQRVRLGLTEYLILDPYIASVDFKSSKELKMAFRSLHAFAKRDIQRYEKSRTKISDTLQKILLKKLVEDPKL